MVKKKKGVVRLFIGHTRAVSIFKGSLCHYGASGCLNYFWNNHLEAKIWVLSDDDVTKSWSLRYNVNLSDVLCGFPVKVSYVCHEQGVLFHFVEV